MASGTPAAQETFVALLQCVSNNNCQDSTCIEQYCPTQVASCGGTPDCNPACGAGETCQNRTCVPTGDCPAPTGGGTDHRDSPRADETWTAAAGPHRVLGNQNIPQGVTLSIEACATVQLAADMRINVSGRLRANGTAGRPVKIEALDTSRPWGQLAAVSTVARPAIELRHTIVSGGGHVSANDPELAHQILVRGAGGPMLLVDHVEVRNSANSGVGVLEEATFAPGSTALTVTGSAAAPLVIDGYALSDLPDGAYTGNGVDRILVTTLRLGHDNQPLELVAHDRGVPYQVAVYGNSPILTLGAPTGSAVTTLRLEAGVQMLFRKDGGIAVASVDGYASGVLIAQGTDSRPVVFGSAAANPQASNWRGLHFVGVPTSDTALDHVVIRHAGSLNSQTSAYSCGAPTAPDAYKGLTAGALSFACNRPVTRQILRNSRIEDSGSNGVDRGWTGEQVDYLSTNTFSRIAYCTQTYPRPTVGSCPDTCP